MIIWDISRNVKKITPCTKVHISLLSQKRDKMWSAIVNKHLLHNRLQTFFLFTLFNGTFTSILHNYFGHWWMVAMLDLSTKVFFLLTFSSPLPIKVPIFWFHIWPQFFNILFCYICCKEEVVSYTHNKSWNIS